MKYKLINTFVVLFLILSFILCGFALFVGISSNSASALSCDIDGNIICIDDFVYHKNSVNLYNAENLISNTLTADSDNYTFNSAISSYSMPYSLIFGYNFNDVGTYLVSYTLSVAYSNGSGHTMALNPRFGVLESCPLDFNDLADTNNGLDIPQGNSVSFISNNCVFSSSSTCFLDLLSCSITVNGAYNSIQGYVYSFPTFSISDISIYKLVDITNSQGYDSGYSNGYSIGNADGYSVGYSSGTNVGYTDGLSSAEALDNTGLGALGGIISATVNTVITAFNTIGSINVFGITIWSLIGLLIALAVIFLIIKIIRGH